MMKEKELEIIFQRPNKSSYHATLTIASTPSMETIEEIATKILNTDELSYLKQVKAPARKKNYVLGRYVAKKSIGRYIKEPDLKTITIKQGTFTHPCPEHPNKPTPNITISHSHNIAIAIACSHEHPLGIDIEKMTDKNKAAIERSSTEQEKKQLQKLNDIKHPFPLHQTALWTIKESLSKAIRTGLMTPFKLIEATNLTPEEHVWTNHFKNFSQYKCHTWSIHENEVTYILSLSLPKKSNIDSLAKISEF